MSRGRFITLEGGDGAGKTTQIARLKDRLVSQGLSVVTTREPGGTQGAEAIRTLLVEGDVSRWSPMSELLLLFAARLNHVEQFIKPNLEKGVWVISDRFADSTYAYQGKAQGLGFDVIDQLYSLTLGAFAPDLTLILDIDPKSGLLRSHDRLETSGNKEDRYERMGHDFHTLLREGFLEVAEAHPERCAVVDASQSPEAVNALIWDIVKQKCDLDSW